VGLVDLLMLFSGLRSVFASLHPELYAARLLGRLKSFFDDRNHKRSSFLMKNNYNQ
jgi:hypothetical protein